MQSKFDQLIKKSFVYQDKTHKVLEVKDVYGKIAIITDKQTFSKLESDFEDFMDAIDLREITAIEEWKPSEAVALKSSALQTEIVVAESNATKVSNKLMEVFDLLAGNPTEETYKKAQAMVNVSNSIVNVQMAQIKFLMLKK